MSDTTEELTQHVEHVEPEESAAPAEAVDPQETVAQVQVPELPEMRFEYQPTDSNGRPIGGKQVIKYRTQEELNAFWQEQNTLLVRKLREETRKNRLGIHEDEATPDGPKFRSPTEFKRKQLSTDERQALSRDLLDPDRFDQATDQFFESTIGVKPSQLGDTIRSLQEDNLRFKAQVETDAFLAANPQYFKCMENYEAITSWMVRKNLEPVRENFQAAYNTLAAAGILVEGDAPAPAVPAAPVRQPQPVQVDPESFPEPEVAPTQAPAQGQTETPRLSSGLNRNVASTTGTVTSAAEAVTYELVDPRTGTRKILKGQAAINAMPADEFRRRVDRDRNFSKLVDKLEREAAVARQTKQRGT
jgi:hypothetical protein